MSETSLAELARQQIEFARNYTLSLIQNVDDSLWFQRPDGCVSHIGWQVAHLATSQYLLTLFRLRGKTAEDAEFISKSFLRQFGKGTTPDPSPEANPSAEEIRAVFHGVYEQMLKELPNYTDADLTQNVIEPYAVSNTLLGSLLFCAHHEMLHAGQIGLIRRQLGLSPVR